MVFRLASYGPMGAKKGSPLGLGYLHRGYRPANKGRECLLPSILSAAFSACAYLFSLVSSYPSLASDLHCLP